jgi:heme A synthase
VLRRQFYDSLTRREAVWGVGAVVGLSMLGGYIRMISRDLAYGDQPRIPQNVGDAAKIALAALAPSAVTIAHIIF